MNSRDVVFLKRSREIKKIEFFSGAEHKIYAVNRSDRLGTQLRIAAQHYNKRLWRCAKCTPYNLAALTLGTLGNCAGIDNTYIDRIAEIRNRKSATDKLPLERRRLRIV